MEEEERSFQLDGDCARLSHLVEEVEVAVEGKLLLHSQSKLGLIAGAI